ncbi:hypothetical protein A9264_07560 [Vibrio sp. UCD-FRSSP16_10]|uniref:hypothetical protein n=1 Tax=unclassified Vibrio TaxID=2614977 RepID=UPI0007FD8C40|nr:MULTISPECIES: hypothetical protein [unclassified Vibrio]OBT07290.1 hypothetical protein A9260_08345 [Vibrio sp. UCD-FRSSP16_30]OBT12770.1 hypothetical protein A9264_07560 [Vibrio sp. UCD-FRSSP16_10]
MQFNTSKLALVTIIASAIALGGCHDSNHHDKTAIKAPDDGELGSLTLTKEEQVRKNQLMVIAGLDAALATTYAIDEDATKDILDAAEAKQHKSIATAFPGSTAGLIPFALQAELSSIQHAMGWPEYSATLDSVKEFMQEISSAQGNGVFNLGADFPYTKDLNGQTYDWNELATQIHYINSHLDTQITLDNGNKKTIRENLSAYYTGDLSASVANIPPLPKASGGTVKAVDLKAELKAKFYLDDQDAQLVLEKASKNPTLAKNIQVMLAKADNDLIFHGTNPADFDFESPATNNTPGYIQTSWTPELKARFMRIFGQVMFLYNTPEFEAKFNDGNNMAMLDKATQGQPGPFNTAMPDNFAQLKADSLVTTESHKLKVILSASKSGFDYGMAAAKGSPQPVVMTVEADTLLHAGFGQVPLVAHEFSHTWGYAHDPVNETMLKPNNIPYYVQFIMGYNQDLHALCGDNAQCHASSKADLGAPTLTWGNSNSIQVKYFGFNTF